MFWEIPPKPREFLGSEPQWKMAVLRGRGWSDEEIALELGFTTAEEVETGMQRCCGVMQLKHAYQLAVWAMHHDSIPPRTTMLLTKRLWEVATLISRGLSTKEIAATLVPPIKPGTVQLSVSRILDRLGLRTREEVAVWVLGLLRDKMKPARTLGETKSARLVPSETLLAPFGNGKALAKAASILNIDVQELSAALVEARQQPEHGVQARRAPVPSGLKMQLLNSHYHSAGAVRRGPLTPYSVSVDGTTLIAEVAIRRDWIDLCIPLGGEEEQCSYVETPPFKASGKAPVRHVAELLAALERKRPTLWDAPTFNLTDLRLTHGELEASFSLDSYIAFRLTFGLLNEEIEQALEPSGITDSSQNAGASLPLRDLLLPDLDALIDFPGRPRPGGGGVLFCYTRPDSPNDFEFLIQRRSPAVGDNPERFCTVPHGFHQPFREPLMPPPPAAELRLSRTMHKQLYKELFGGTEAVRDPRWLVPEWIYAQSQPLEWLLKNRTNYAYECVAFGVNIIHGTYEFSTLLAIENPEFYAKFWREMQDCWERTNIQPFSTHDPVQLTGMLKRFDWSSVSPFVLVEGLKRLALLYPPGARRGPSVRLPQLDSLV